MLLEEDTVAERIKGRDHGMLLSADPMAINTVYEVMIIKTDRKDMDVTANNPFPPYMRVGVVKAKPPPELPAGTNYSDWRAASDTNTQN
nr:hypothetical protein BaRGS_003844 [Batillaria attramentaria]